ncbi:cation diffusion facilitator family transporter containing protein [Aphelenchoides avenae]|nr:cation diffusion facilitator family transporter containing protein [Aphelenchus avenae]
MLAYDVSKLCALGSFPLNVLKCLIRKYSRKHLFTTRCAGCYDTCDADKRLENTEYLTETSGNMDASYDGNISNVEIDAHSINPAVVVKYDTYEGNTVKPVQKIIHLKDLNESVDPNLLAKHILEQCPFIPHNRVVELEQVIFYLQKRVSVPRPSSRAGSAGAVSRARMENVENYVEMLYEENEKPKSVALILELALNPANAETLTENEVLMGALARVFREDSRKNFEVATNIANIFYQFSQNVRLQPAISHYKIGALSMQLIEYELKRWDMWNEQAQTMNEKNRLKWEFAMKKQDQLIAACLKILLNLADDIKVEHKMIKRGMIPILVKCLDHVASASLLKTTVTFVWKLSVFSENKDAMGAEGIVEKLVRLLPKSDAELTELVFVALFNLSFDPTLRTRMVSAGLVNYVAPHIEGNRTALALLYQLSILDDAKAMIIFTDAINTLMRLFAASPACNLTKALLINIALEKRNAQVICGTNGQGLDSLIRTAFDRNDPLAMKVVRNCASHDGPTQDLFLKHMSKFLEAAVAKIDPKGLATTDHTFGMECLGTAAQIVSADWHTLQAEARLTPWIKNVLASAAVTNGDVADDVLLQVIVLCGTMAAQQQSAQSIVPFVDDLVVLLRKNQDDDEIVLQIVFLINCLFSHPSICAGLCGEESEVVEYLINLMHDKNPQLRAVCDQALQLVATYSEAWSKRIVEERFRYHNAQWIEMVSSGADNFSGFSDESADQFQRVISAEVLLDS